MDILIGGLLGGVGAVALAQAWLVWRASRALTRVTAIEARIEKFGDALALLTDTTESAFRAVAAEMSRSPVRPATQSAVSSARTRRMARAATRGASIEQIAAAEEVAEGEVRLRLQLANDQPARAPRKPAAKPAPARKKARANGKKREVARGAVRVD